MRFDCRWVGYTGLHLSWLSLTHLCLHLSTLSLWKHSHVGAPQQVSDVGYKTGRLSFCRRNIYSRSLPCYFSANKWTKDTTVLEAQSLLLCFSCLCLMGLDAATQLKRAIDEDMVSDISHATLSAVVSAPPTQRSVASMNALALFVFHRHRPLSADSFTSFMCRRVPHFLSSTGINPFRC